MTPDLFLDSLLFGTAFTLIILGLIGTVIPVIPGSFLILLTLVGYMWVNGMQEIGIWMGMLMILITVVSGTADWWLPALGVRNAGGSRIATVYGVIGGLIGMFFFFFIGSIVGYALGVLVGSYQTHRDLRIATRASLIGVAGQGAATLVQLGGGIIVLILFIRAVLLA